MFGKAFRITFVATVVFLFSLSFYSIAKAQCVNQMVCKNDICEYVDVCDSYNDRQSVFEDLKPYSPPAYGSSGYSAYDAPVRCYDKYVNGAYIKVCK